MRLILITLCFIAVGTRAAPPPPNTEHMDFASCTTSGCHSDKMAKKFSHAPISTNKCFACHKPIIGEHKFRILDYSSRVCVDCHQEFLKKNVEITKRGVRIKVNDKFYYSHNFNKKVPKAMEDRHFQEKLQGHQMKFYGKELTCLTCHSPHNGDNKYFLRDFSENEQFDAFCSRCHDNLQSYEKYSGHPITTKANKLKDLNCNSCHNVHRANSEFLLEVSHKGENNLCAKCHKEKFTTVSHPIKEDGCVTCHSLHKGLPSTIMLKAGHDGKELVCFDCHKDKRAILGTKHDYATWPHELKGQVYKLFDYKKPISIQCQLCHDMHNGASKGNLLLASKVSKEEYVVTAACLTCHKEANLENVAKIDNYAHPVPLLFKNIRDPKSGQTVSMNFYAESGEKEKETNKIYNVVCSTCHNPHQWSKDPKAKKTEHGDLATSFLIDNKAAMKFCATCHGQEAIFRYSMFHFDYYRRK